MHAGVKLVVLLVVLGVAPLTAWAAAGDYSAWSPAVRVESMAGADPSFNGPDLDGCPFISRDGKTFYMASTRPGGLGGIDIWVATRASADDAWGAPVNVGPPVNSPQNDFCPTISRDGRLFYFVSNRPGFCGGDDIFVTRLRRDGWDPVENLGCDVNSSASEASPFPLPERSEGPVLYFSSNRAGGFSAEAPGAVSGDADLYVSESNGGVFGPAELVPGANSAPRTASRTCAATVSSCSSSAPARGRSAWPTSTPPRGRAPRIRGRPPSTWDRT